MQQFRQGDVLIHQVTTAIPKEATKEARDNGRIVLAYGEVTGHAHAIKAPNSTLYAWQGDRLLEVTDKPVELQHEEHGTITIPEGTWKITRQREYDPILNRQVAD